MNDTHDGCWDEEAKVAWTRTWYGRGTPYGADEVEKRVRAAYRQARAHATGVIWFGSDEDAYFAGDEAVYEPTPPELIEPVTDEEAALRIYWNNYASCMTEQEARELGFGSWIDRFGKGMIEEGA